MVDDSFEILKIDVLNSIKIYIPEITVEKLDIVPTYNTNLVTINLTYRVNISNEKDTITINLE